MKARLAGVVRLLGTWGPGSVERNTIVSGARTLVRTIVGLVLLPFLIGSIGQEATGLFLWAITLTSYFTAVELGLVTGVTKHVAEFRATNQIEQLNSVMRGSLILMLFVGAITAVVLGGVALFAARDLFAEPSVVNQAKTTLLVGAAASFFYWPSRLGTAALEGLERYDLSAAIQIGSSILTLVAVVVTTSVTDSVAVLVAVFGTIVALEGVLGGALALPHLGLRRGLGSWRGKDLRPVLAFGGSLFVIGISDTLIYSLDNTIVAGFVGAAAVTVYQLALRPHNGLRAFASMAGGALVSPVARLAASHQMERLRELTLIASYVSILITTPLAVLVIILARPFLEAWVGPHYTAAQITQYAFYVQLFASYWLLHGNTGGLGPAITGLGRLRVFVWLTVVGAVVSIVLSVWLVALWGTVGVIWGTVIPSVIGLPLWVYLALRHVGIPGREYLGHVAVPAYLVVVGWSAVVFGAKLAINPHGWIGLGVFGTLALASFWSATFRPLKARWQRALAA